MINSDLFMLAVVIAFAFGFGIGAAIVAFIISRATKK